MTRTDQLLRPFDLAANLLDPQETEDDVVRGLKPWRQCRRPNQVPPLDPVGWYLWLILAGRGWGKTRTGAEWLIDEMLAFPNYLYGILGPTFDECRDVMVEGESGLQACCEARKIRCTFNRSLGHFLIAGGATTHLFTGEKPDGGRGPNIRALWGDEPASWKYGQTVWDTIQFAVRKGDVRVCVTGTPKATPFVRHLVASADVITKGNSEENRANLSEKYYSRVIAPYVGTRLGRQELNAEILEDVEGALWTLGLIEETRVLEVPSHQEFDVALNRFVAIADLAELLVGVDPSVTNNPARNAATGLAQRASDEAGVIAAALGEDGHGYVLADRSGRMAAEKWCEAALNLYDQYEADKIIGEINHGHDLIEITLRAVCRSQGRPIPAFGKINASRGKVVRAEPVAALYEQRKVHHVGLFPQLEDEMTTWVPNVKGQPSPNRLDALVYDLSELMLRKTGRKLGYSIS